MPNTPIAQQVEFINDNLKYCNEICASPNAIEKYKAILASLQRLAAPVEVPPVPRHTDSCNEQAKVTWMCDCDFPSRNIQYADALRAAFITQSAQLAECKRDAERLTELEEMFRMCPHAVITHNDDPDLEDDNGIVPLGYSIRVHGCTSLDVAAPTLREAIDLMTTEPDEDGDVTARVRG